jgi:flagellar protein FlgJ
MTTGPSFIDLHPAASPLHSLRPAPAPLRHGISLQDDPQREAAKVDDVAHDFEALLVKQIFAAMRPTVTKESGGFGEEMFTSMLDDQLASHIADAGGLGLADSLTQVLRESVDALPDNQEENHGDGPRT